MFSNWLNMLLGRPKKLSQVKTAKEERSTKTGDSGDAQPSAGSAEAGDTSEDSVAQDIAKFKSFAGGLKESISTSLKPALQKGSESKKTIASSATGIFDKKFLRRLIKIFLIVIFLLVILAVAFSLFKNGGIGGGDGGDVSPTETLPAPTFQPTSPSVYSGDKTVLGIEESLNVLEREVAGTRIDDTTIEPPALDYDVSF